MLDSNEREILKSDIDVEDDDVKREMDVCLQNSITTPPDGGWGWLVCFACFMTHVLTDGTFYSFGVTFLELLDYYQESKGSTAALGSLTFGVCSLSGPINAAMSNRFGFRKTTIFGTFLMTTSFICSIFSPNVFCLYITFGISGWGFGMVYLSSIVCLSMYFDKKRSLAVGLGVSGSGIGTFIFGLLTKVLIDAYSWKGAIVIQGGLMLNCVACGLIYLPADHSMKRAARTAMIKSSTNNTKLIVRTNKSCTKSDFDESLNMLPEKEQFNAQRDNDCEDTLTLTVSTDRKPNAMTYPAGKDCMTDFNYPIENSVENHVIRNERRHFRTQGERMLLDEIILAMRKSFNFSVFKNKAFLLFILSTVFYAAGYFIPYIYLPDMAESSGVDSFLSASLVSSIGITNTAGRIIFGFISDKKCVNKLLLYNVALMICGVGTAICPLLQSFGGLLTFTIIFGLFSGVTVSLTSVIVAELVGTSMLADAFGALTFFAGLFNFVGPPIAGMLFDITNSYDVPFIAAGVVIVIGGAILFTVPCTQRRST